MMQTMTSIGLMSGTSVDGLDVCCATFTLKDGQWSFHIDCARGYDYPPDLKQKLGRDVQNMSAYEFVAFHSEYGRYLGQRVNEFMVESVVYYYLPEQALYEVPRDNCSFGYRSSIFQQYSGFAILSAVFRLPEGDKEEIAAKMRELNERRRDKQPLDLPSAGSAFKRPEGHYAAALIDEAGLKGYTVGGAQVSEKHAGFVVNKGGATSHDVYDLMMHVRNTVYEKTGIEMQPEIILLPPDYQLIDDSPAVPRNHVIINDAGGES